VYIKRDKGNVRKMGPTEAKAGWCMRRGKQKGTRLEFDERK